MLQTIVENNRVIGFTYYPVLEIVLGVFFLFCSMFVPVLFYKYNGFKTEQWGEWLFVIGFFALFFLLGKSLAWQSLKVELKDNNICLMQDMREPSVNLQIPFTELEDILFETKELSNNNSKDFENMYFINVKYKGQVGNFYQTRSKKEADKIFNTFKTLLSENKGVSNE